MAKEKPDEPAKTELSGKQKIRGFLIGFIGWYVINGSVWLVVFINFSLLPLPFLMNVMGMIILGNRSRSISAGVFAAYAINLVITLIMGGVATAGIFFTPFFTPGIQSHFSDDFGCERSIAFIIMIAATLYARRLWKN